MAAGARCVEVFLGVSLNLRGTAPARRDLVAELTQTVSQLRLIDGRGKLLRGEETVWLDGARLPTVALGDIENGPAFVLFE